MELKNLMSGIAVVIDDKINTVPTDEDGKDGDGDPIVKIVEWIEQEWGLPFYKANELPSLEIWPNLFRAANFIMLDWLLWPSGSSQLEESGIETNCRFLEQAKDYFVPVFIFTNESPEDVESHLPEYIYREGSPVFIQDKASLLVGDSLDVGKIENWIKGNASVYALKTWEQAFHAAKKDLFSSMYARSPDWPKVFWEGYKTDGVDPSSSLMHLINDSLLGRMRTDTFEAEILAASKVEVPGEDLRALIGETSFRSQETLPTEEIRCGDLFMPSNGKFLLNLRADCDCVPRGIEANEVELYCVEGEVMSDSELSRKYKNGQFDEGVSESVAFSVYKGKSIRFKFKKFRIEKFSELRTQHVGRLLHPHLTKIQQRFCLYLQRQGLPRIPKAAVPPHSKS